jgi:hypothetical protein
MDLFIIFDKTAKPEAAAQLSNEFSDQVLKPPVRYRNQKVTETGIHWLVMAQDARSVQEQIQAVVGGRATAALRATNNITVTPA